MNGSNAVHVLAASKIIVAPSSDQVSYSGCDVLKSRYIAPETRTGDPIFTDSHGNLLKDQMDRQERIRSYTGGGNLKDELLSPLWAKSFEGLPPILLCVTHRFTHQAR